MIDDDNSQDLEPEKSPSELAVEPEVASGVIETKDTEKQEAVAPVATDAGAESDTEQASEDSTEVIVNGEFLGEEDPLAEAFDLDGGSIDTAAQPEILPWRSEVNSPKEFFKTEILYRFDIIEPRDLEALKGNYRIELQGEGAGVWDLEVSDQLEVTSGEGSEKEADTTLTMLEKDFLEIVNGSLNPQLAILAKKIKVQGDVRRAVRFQDLISPNPEA